MNKNQLYLKVFRIKKETGRVKSFFFKHELFAKPGQFVMLHVPKSGERPFAVLEEKKGYFSVAVAKVGTATNIGEKVGLRGPFGSFFTLPSKKGKLLFAGGGYGMVPLVFLALAAVKKGFESVLLNGAGTSGELMYKTFKHAKIKMHFATIDGSKGKKGTVVDLLNDVLKKEPKFIKVYACGPELMEYEIAKILWSKKIPFEVSLERFMKCGIGVCGSCCVDKTGWRMCVEGPVLNGEKLKKVSEFGKYHRLASGKIAYYKNGQVK